MLTAVQGDLGRGRKRGGRGEGVFKPADEPSLEDDDARTASESVSLGQ